MKNLSTIAKELGVSLATVSYVYNDKWRENRIRPELAARVRRKIENERGAPSMLARQFRTGRTQTVGILLPHLDQPYFLKLLAGIEQGLSEGDCMAMLGVAHFRWQERQVELIERMAARQVDALVVCPRPAKDLSDRLTSLSASGGAPVVFVDNYLADCPVARAVSDNRWGAREAVKELVDRGCCRILFLGGHSKVAALRDRHAGYCDALESAGMKHVHAHTIWRDRGDEVALPRVRRLLETRNPPDAIFVTSFFQFSPYLELLAELNLSHPNDVSLAGFDEPMATWSPEAVRQVIHKPLFVVEQAAADMGRVAVELALSAAGGADTSKEHKLIRPTLCWRHND